MRLLTLLLAIVIAVAACSAPPRELEKPANPLAGRTNEYICDANIICGELEMSVSITRRNPQSCTVEFTAPDTLEGILLTFIEDSMDMSYLGLEFSVKSTSLPSAMPVALVLSVLNRAAADNGVTVTESAENIILSGNIRDGAFELLLDKAGKHVLSLAIPEYNLTANFEGLAFAD